MKNDMKEILKSKLENLSQELVACKEEVLGSLLFTCSGRIPEQKLSMGSYLPHQLGDVYMTLDTYETELDDVKSFQEVFPKAPISGFYSNGEIGPTEASHTDDLLVPWFQSSDREGVTDDSGASVSDSGGLSDGCSSTSSRAIVDRGAYRAQMQGYTAVFGIFLKPTKMVRNAEFLNIDTSSSSALSLYVKKRFGDL